MIKLPKDPLYEISDHDRAWLIALAVAVAIAAGIFVAIGTELSRAESESESPAPAELQETRTQVETGRMICQRWSDKGCVEWRIYRTTSY